MIKLEHSVVINRPIEEVFAFVSDLDKMSQWAGEVVESKITSEGPMGVGTTFIGVGKMLGRRMESINEVTKYEPNRKYGFKTTSGPIPSELEWTFESVAGGTKVAFAIEAEPGGFFKLATPIIARVARRQFESNLANLKDLLEAGV